MARRGTNAGPRQQWYDRNPITSVQQYEAAGIAPHALTTRWTYTTPSGKKAYVENAAAFVFRETAPGAAGRAGCYVQVVATNASQLAIGEEISTAVGVSVGRTSGQNATLLAGNVCRCQTVDLSTGGTYLYRGTAKLTEFDA